MKRISTIQTCILIGLLVLILAFILFGNCSRLFRKCDSKSRVADFEGAPRTGKAFLQVTFTDHSFGNVIAWDWRFKGGDPEEAGGQGPHTVIYRNPGEYDVSLMVLFYPSPNDTVPVGHTTDKRKYIKVTP